MEKYRSIRDLKFRLKATNVLTGPNGCGKSNLYNSLFLLSKAAEGGLAKAIVEEGGMDSILWAGKWLLQERRRVQIAVEMDKFSYALSCGLPQPGNSQFNLDPEVKEEFVWLTGKRRPSNTMFERSSSGTWIRDREGARVSYTGKLLPTESVLSQLREPHLYPELSELRSAMNQWRFYHHFRTDASSPLRQPQVGVRTPVLSHDGNDLAAALQTIFETGDGGTLRETICEAFSGASLFVDSEGSRFQTFLQMRGLQRPLGAQELSDGTLRYLCLAASLLSPRPPSLLALNEPETSLHPDLLKPLAKLIARASQSTQLWVTTHSRALAEYIEEFSGDRPVELHLMDGETRIVGQGLVLPDDD